MTSLDGNARPDLLFLAHRVPYPPDKGDRIRTYHLLKNLGTAASIHLACLADEPVAAESIAALRRCCRRVAIVPIGKLRHLHAAWSLLWGGSATVGAFDSPALRAVVARWSRETCFDAAVASSSGIAPHLFAPELDGVPAIVDMMDVDSQKWIDYAATAPWPKSQLYATEGRRLRQYEREIAGRARAVVFVSDAEAEEFRGITPAGHVCVVPNGVDLEYFPPAEAVDEPTCVFVGALDYRPNVDAACWFCREVWPRVHRRQPQARCLLVGRRPVPAVQRLGGIAGIEVIGQVPDVRPWLRQAAISVNPLRIARGVQNKVLEALAMARAVIASPQALAGLGVSDGVEALSAATVSDWEAAILRLFEDAELRQRMGQAGRRFVEEHHRWDTCVEPFAALVANRRPGVLSGN